MNVLIVGNDSVFVKALYDGLSKSSKIQNVKIADCSDTNYIIDSQNTIYDLMVLDFDFATKIIKNGILWGIAKDYIVLCSTYKKIENYYNNSNVIRVYKMPVEAKEILQFLNKIYNLFPIQNKSNLTNNNILLKLAELGFNISHVGTSYLADCINYKTSNEVCKTKSIYEEVAKKYYKDPNTINWAIYNCVESAYNNDSDNKLSKFFKLYDGRKPTPKYIIDFFATLCR